MLQSERLIVYTARMIHVIVHRRSFGNKLINKLYPFGIFDSS